MPIHVSFKSMARGMGKEYKEGKVVCRDFTDGSKVCISEKAWSVFFATLNKKGWDESKSMPKSTSEALEEWLRKKMEQESEEVKNVGEVEKIKQSKFVEKWIKAKGLEVKDE